MPAPNRKEPQMS
jgi:hypothetical protein